MKINPIPSRKLALLCAVLAGAFLAFSPNASALTIGDGHYVGLITHGNVGDTFESPSSQSFDWHGSRPVGYVQW